MCDCKYHVEAIGFLYGHRHVDGSLRRKRIGQNLSRLDSAVQLAMDHATAGCAEMEVMLLRIVTTDGRLACGGEVINGRLLWSSPLGGNGAREAMKKRIRVAQTPLRRSRLSLTLPSAVFIECARQLVKSYNHVAA